MFAGGLLCEEDGKMPVGRIARGWSVVVFLTLSCVALSSSAIGQPAIPGPEFYGYTVVDLGDIAIGQAPILPAAVPVTPGGFVYFRFNLTTATSPLESWLDMDTGGASINTEMAIYDAWANRKAIDDDSGPVNASAMSFGGGSGERLGGGSGRISDGAWGILDPGIYYVAVVGRDATFDDPNADWHVATNNTAAGTVRLRLQSGQVPSTYWNERFHGDAGETIGSAQRIEGNGPLTSLVTFFAASDRDMFKIRICDPASFSVVAKLSGPTTSGSGESYRARLFLFDSTGRGVVAINNTAEGTLTTLHLPPDTSQGEYFLVVQDYCEQESGDVEPGPFDASGDLIWTFADPATANQVLEPNGPGGANPLESWGRLDSSCEVSSYYASLSLTGACYLTIRATCPVDFDGDDKQGLFDFAAFQNCFEGP